MSETGAPACWRCRAELDTSGQPLLVCPACNALQSPPQINHFELFELSPAYELDLDALEDGYRSMSRLVHPDRFATAEPREKRFSLEWSTLLNEAYATLRDPLRRAEYLLNLSGVPTQDESRTVMDPAFLSDQMEFRERLEEARDSSDPLATLDALRRDIRSATTERMDGLRTALGGEAPRNAASAAILIQELKFFRKLLEEANRLEEQFD